MYRSIRGAVFTGLRHAISDVRAAGLLPRLWSRKLRVLLFRRRGIWTTQCTDTVGANDGCSCDLGACLWRAVSTLGASGVLPRLWSRKPSPIWGLLVCCRVCVRVSYVDLQSMVKVRGRHPAVQLCTPGTSSEYC